MRNVFKTSYVQDIRLFEHGGQALWFGVLGAAVLAAPWILPQYYTGEMALMFVFAIAGIGLMLLTGYTGLASLGHAAFLGIGAYAHTYFVQKLGLPFPVAIVLAGLVSAAFGIAFALPALRMTGIYLAIATFAFAVIMEQVFNHWRDVTGGFRGLRVAKPNLFGWELASDRQIYYLCLAVLVLVVLGAANVLRSATGRAMIAIRDSEVSAQSMGINIAFTKVKAFGLSTFVTGVAGALYAHKIGYISPESFDILVSITFLLMIVVGGLGSLHGCIFGAIVVVGLQAAISLGKELLPPKIGQFPALKDLLFGGILVLFIIFEPLGIYGRWRKLRLYFGIFPLYRRATFKRQRGYLKTERMK
jgi:branched-chain amino acid transport system permease protein